MSFLSGQTELSVISGVRIKWVSVERGSTLKQISVQYTQLSPTKLAFLESFRKAEI